MNINENLLHQVAARFIKGKDIDVNINGSEVQLEALQDLLNTSKDLMSELKKSNPNVDIIIELTNKKKQLTKRFQNITGIKWKL
jgi:ribosomal protein L21E